MTTMIAMYLPSFFSIFSFALLSGVVNKDRVCLPRFVQGYAHHQVYCVQIWLTVTGKNLEAAPDQLCRNAEDYFYVLL